jgi:hypothetical protein
LEAGQPETGKRVKKTTKMHQETVQEIFEN